MQVAAPTDGNAHPTTKQHTRRNQKKSKRGEGSDPGTQVSYQSFNRDTLVLLYSSMCYGLSLLPLLDSHIVGQ